jgi:hypothetical protein
VSYYRPRDHGEERDRLCHGPRPDLAERGDHDTGRETSSEDES